MGSFAKQLSETAPTWGRAVAPVAEWVAQAFSNSIRRPQSSKSEIIPTRLTQRRRSEGRGNPFVPRVTSAPRRQKICEMCGAEGVQNRYCPSCAVEVSRENMVRVAAVGREKSRTPRAKARMSRAQSEHASAISWWSPSSLPAWLTEECYVQKIQPQLRAIKVREIAQALQVSRPYAALVRAGHRRPHPRHWQPLAKLVAFGSESC